MRIFLILHLPFVVVSYSQWHYESFCGYTSPLCTQRLLSEPLWNLDMCEGGSLLFQYRMERFYTGIVIGIPFPAEGMYHPPAVQVSLKGLACVLASQITMDEDSLRLLHIQTGIFYCLHCQFCRHGQTISISDNLTAVQVHHTSQIGPAFFQNMNVGNIRTPFLMNRLGLKITSQDIGLIIRDSSVIRMVVILFYHDRPQPLVGHMPLDALDTAGNSAAIEDMTYFNSTIPLF